MKYTLLLLLATSFAACNSNDKSTANTAVDKSTQVEVFQSEDSFSFDPTRIITGSIQGISEDNPLYRIALRYYENYQKPSYEMYFIPKVSLTTLRNLSDSYWDSARTNGFKDQQQVLVVIPMTDPDSLPDYHDYNIIHPCRVEVYIKEGNIRKPVIAKTINSFEELGNFRAGIILDLLKRNDK